MSFIFKRIIYFQDTDAAGVVYFTNILAMCHEAYEESLATSGINLQAFFSNPDMAIPIVHASVDFFRPMFCGDKIFIQLIPKQLASEKFEIAYQILTVSEQLIATAVTKHICIEPINRTRKAMPDEMIQWLQQWDG